MKKSNKEIFKKNLLLAILVVVIAIIPLVFMKNAKFSGSDDNAKQQITKIDKDYKPWFSPIWQPPSAEIESLLFAVQAAIGTGVVCYYFGYQKGKARREDTDKK